ncbi:MAG: hypothetical protein U0002_20135 [Thermoanaerobaculia bacterium]
MRFSTKLALVLFSLLVAAATAPVLFAEETPAPAAKACACCQGAQGDAQGCCAGMHKDAAPAQDPAVGAPADPKAMAEHGGCAHHHAMKDGAKGGAEQGCCAHHGAAGDAGGCCGHHEAAGKAGGCCAGCGAAAKSHEAPAADVAGAGCCACCGAMAKGADGQGACPHHAEGGDDAHHHHHHHPN